MEGKMMDAISRSAVLKEIDWAIDLAMDDEMHHAMCTLGERFKELPALDVAPVVHARWIVKRMAGNTIALQCSACENYDNPSKVRGNFCWNCGARVDGEAE